MQTTRRLIPAMFAAAMVVAGCGATADPSVFPSPTASPAPSPRSATSGPSASPPASQAIGPTPSPEPYAPVVGTTVITVSDQLRVRSEPEVSDASTRYEPLLPLGTELRVLEGPVSRSGYVWYRVAPQSVELAGGVTDGWVAIASTDGEPWIGDVATARPSSEPSPEPSPSTAPASSPEPSASVAPSPLLQPGPNTAPPPLGHAKWFYDVAWTGTRFAIAGAMSGDGTSDTEEIAWWSSINGATWSMSEQRSAGVASGSAFEPSGRGIAVGYFGSAAAVWVTQDGVDWQAVPTQPAFLPLDGADTIRLRQVAFANSGYVAIGELGVWAVILTSPDGLTWSRSVSGPALTRVTLEDIAGRNDRYVVVGHFRYPYRGTIWTSGDGASWTEQPAPPESAPIRNGESRVVAGPGGWLMTAFGQGGMRLWRSADGASWSTTVSPPSPHDFSFPQLTAAQWGFVGITTEGDCSSDIWMTSDSASWVCSEPPAPNVWAPEWKFAASDTALVAISITSTWVARLGR